VFARWKESKPRCGFCAIHETPRVRGARQGADRLSDRLLRWVELREVHVGSERVRETGVVSLRHQDLRQVTQIELVLHVVGEREPASMTSAQRLEHQGADEHGVADTASCQAPAAAATLEQQRPAEVSMWPVEGPAQIIDGDAAQNRQRGDVDLLGRRGRRGQHVAEPVSPQVVRMGESVQVAVVAFAVDQWHRRG
jgi:hypothetical protein